jgi:deoxycytidine triphosphate deaminase
MEPAKCTHIEDFIKNLPIDPVTDEEMKKGEEFMNDSVQELKRKVIEFRKVIENESNEKKLKIKKLSENATVPKRATEKSAGYDLSSAYDFAVPAHGKELIKTDLSMTVPDGCYGRIAPRSSLAWKNFIDVAAGVIDAGYLVFIY